MYGLECFFLTLITVFAYEKDITFSVQAGSTDCFYHKVLVRILRSFLIVGRVIVADYKKQENAHRHTSILEGDYRICFDNTFSTFSQKTVKTYMMRVSDIVESVIKLKENVSAARRLQELLSAHEARDRNLAEEMCA
ncbi:unnamed protein product, partial [Leptidea sinapis]